MKLPIILLAALAVAPSVYSQIFYTEDFSGVVGGEWSSTTTSTTPVGSRPFLGEFNNATVALSLSGLPAHGEVTVSFDLFVIRTWDGNSVAGTGEDHWKLSVGDSGSQAVVLNTSFANAAAPGQSYPDSFASGLSHPAHTGASEVNTLGYLFNGVVHDSVYNLSFTVPHTASTFGAKFEDILNSGILDESWGIANVTVSTSAVPEPGEYAAAFGLCLAGFAAWRRRSLKVANVAAQAA